MRECRYQHGKAAPARRSKIRMRYAQLAPMKENTAQEAQKTEAACLVARASFEAYVKKAYVKKAVHD
jgi:hypothetical protein